MQIFSCVFSGLKGRSAFSAEVLVRLVLVAARAHHHSLPLNPASAEPRCVEVPPHSPQRQGTFGTSTERHLDKQRGAQSHRCPRHVPKSFDNGTGLAAFYSSSVSPLQVVPESAFR